MMPQGMSLASTSAKDEASSLEKAFQASTEAGPPCHQTMEGEDEQNKMKEVMTVMPSISYAHMKHYQMKLLVPKKNAEAYLIGVSFLINAKLT